MDIPEELEDKKKDKKKKHHRSRSDSDHKKKKKGSRERSRSAKRKDKDRKHKKSRSRSKEVRQDKSRYNEKDYYGDKDKYKSKDDYDRYAKPNDYQSRKRYEQKDYRNEGRNDSNRRDRYRDDKYSNWKKEKDSSRFRFDSPPKSDDSDMSGDPQKMDKLNKMKAQQELVTSKADRKLYLGNLPPNITSAQLMQMLNTALKKMEINCDDDGDSIVSAWISPDGVGHYAFVEFRSPQEATNGLALNGASLYGYQLKLGRPKQYIQYHKQLLSEFGNDGNIDTIIKKVKAMGGYSDELLKVEEKIICPPSRIIILKHIVTIEELAIDEEYNEIVEDVTEMAKRHGDIIKIVIPRPQSIDLQEVQQRVKGLGYIFIKYKSVEQGKYARKQFIKQMFNERSVACSYFSEQRFEEGELDLAEKVVIDF